jgi:hypothetical protein
MPGGLCAQAKAFRYRRCVFRHQLSSRVFESKRPNAWLFFLALYRPIQSCTPRKAQCSTSLPSTASRFSA